MLGPAQPVNLDDRRTDRFRRRGNRIGIRIQQRPIVRSVGAVRRFFEPQARIYVAWSAISFPPIQHRPWRAEALRRRQHIKIFLYTFHNNDWFGSRNTSKREREDVKSVGRPAVVEFEPRKTRTTRKDSCVRVFRVVRGSMVHSARFAKDGEWF